ncbi:MULTISPECIES: 2-hydroxyacid dehydrogenase [Pseudomonas]|uniref:2-hydroxyacid dehydrogenase n=1 Tax=Pseudomonas syringae TaxID=317 RepID=A0A085V2M9_PSESX|nr:MULTISPECIES: glyoxylate/hydroxypyruvate reductase A [Pseudomonas]EPJ78087.1 D-isomer specific 2-hydroxyacid dehydrogenase, NAD-binding protein [Pseudomonas sp. CFII64]KFE49692.1 2-hydroxyacid dehydrogenase [Pseudomonas syringae]
MKPLVLLGTGNGLERVREMLLAREPELNIVRPDDADAQQAEIALCWNPAPGSLGMYPYLRLIHSIAAGADQIFKDPSRDPQIPVCRIVDPDHRLGMVEYVLWGVLHYHRGFDQVLRNQAWVFWDRPAQRPAKQTKVGVMGLGELGRAVASQLAALDFDTRGWARRAQQIEGVTTFQAGEIKAFLSELDILVCLLPLTPETVGILGEETFAQMAPGSVVINCGRGEHLNREDLLAALDSGQLRSALLDVFEQEPLPVDDPFWRHPQICVTPHIASSASYEVIAGQILDNLARLEAGTPLANEINPEQGY